MLVITNNAIKFDHEKGLIKAGEKINLAKDITVQLIKSGAVSEYVKTSASDDKSIGDSVDT